jgi:hypothetical protein
MLAIVKLMSSVEEELETHWTFLEVNDTNTYSTNICTLSSDKIKLL